MEEKSISSARFRSRNLASGSKLPSLVMVTFKVRINKKICLDRHGVASGNINQQRHIFKSRNSSEF